MTTALAIATASPDPRPKKRILVVESAPALRAYWNTVFAGSGVAERHYATRERAVARLKQLGFQVDGVIYDRDPDFTADEYKVELTRFLRKLVETPYRGRLVLAYASESLQKSLRLQLSHFDWVANTDPATEHGGIEGLQAYLIERCLAGQ